MEGNIRKMRTELSPEGEAQYYLNLYNILDKGEELHVNPLVGSEVTFRFDGKIHCVATGKEIKKTFGEGLSYEAFVSSPLAVESIIRPELSRIHEGIALRDEEWEKKHHLQPHYTYLSLTSGIKVGVTRSTQIPHRWIDQGAEQGLILAETPYRQAAGLIEVALKEFVTDKTNWRKMLKNEKENQMAITEAKEMLLDELPPEFEEFVVWDNGITEISYPVQEYPIKVNSIKLDKLPEFTKKLAGIKGQYFIFSDNTVMNIRSHAGYRISFEY